MKFITILAWSVTDSQSCTPKTGRCASNLADYSINR